MTKRVAAIASLLAVTTLVACSSQEPPVTTAADPPRELAGKVTIDGMSAHLRQLQDIADANDGNRAEGTAGFDASVDYVAQALQDKGFDVQTAEFTRLTEAQRGNPTLTVAGRGYPVDQASLLTTTPAGGVSAVANRPATQAGCTPADYGNAPVRGVIAVVDDEDCSIVDKQNAAVAKGAVALLVVSDPGGDGRPRGLFPRGYYDELKIPVAVIGDDVDAAVRRTSARVRLTLDSKSAKVASRNVLAQTKTGDTANIVLVGAHLDSVPVGPGINDNGSGVAAVLETALQMGSTPAATNTVRFGFWGSEEQALSGSRNYVSGLDRDQLNDIAVYLNFDILGSPNAGYFTYDGDQSGPPNPDLPADEVPVGSAGVERTLAGYLNLAGKRPADQPLGATTDYSSFLTAGVPIGGATTGASQVKNQVQARLWGGRAGLPFDANYHSSRDTLANVDSEALSVMGSAVAFAVGTYAQSIDGVNGVPSRDDRRRAPAGP